MGTSYQVKIEIHARHKGYDAAWQVEYEKARSIFHKNNVDGCLTNDRLTDVGKWDWDKCLKEVCNDTHGLVFSVFSVSEYGNVQIDFYSSGYGFLYTDTPQVVFSPAKEKAAKKRNEQYRNRQLKLEKSAVALKEQALNKLSPEERVALGLGV